jgi:hypothetical protein
VVLLKVSIVGTKVVRVQDESAESAGRPSGTGLRVAMDCIVCIRVVGTYEGPTDLPSRI